MVNEHNLFGYIINVKRYDTGTKEMRARTFREFSKGSHDRLIVWNMQYLIILKDNHILIGS
jgi:hypothetical protein